MRTDFNLSKLEGANPVVTIQDIRARLAIVSSEIRYLEGSHAVIEAETAEIRHHLEHIAQALDEIEPPRRVA